MAPIRRQGQNLLLKFCVYFIEVLRQTSTGGNIRSPGGTTEISRKLSRITGAATGHLPQISCRPGRRIKLSHAFENRITHRRARN